MVKIYFLHANFTSVLNYIVKKQPKIIVTV